MTLIALGVLLITSPSYGQTITSSGFEDFDLNNSSLSFIAKRYNYYYFLKQDNDANYAMVFDTSMNRKAIIDLDFLPESRQKFSILSNRDGFVCMYKNRDRKDTTVIERVELNDYMRVTQRPQSIDTLDPSLDVLTWLNSPSEYYTMVVCERRIKRSKTSDELYLYLYDQTGQRLKEVIIPKIYNPEDVVLEIDNQGTIFFAQPTEEPKPMSIWTCKIDDPGLSQNFLTQENYLVNKFFLHQNPANNSMYYIVDFMKVGAEGNLRGFGFGDIDAQSQINYHEVDNQENTTLMRLFSSTNTYKLRYLNPTQARGLVIGLEEYDLKSNTVILNAGIGNGGTYTRVEHEYQLGDIHLLHVDSAGHVVWNNIFPKFQMSTGDLDPSLSYGIINKGSSITLYYNQVENKNKVILEGKTIYPDGTSKDLFFVWKNAKKDFRFLVSKGAQISLGESVVPVYSQGKLGLAKIDMY